MPEQHSPWLSDVLRRVLDLSVSLPLLLASAPLLALLAMAIALRSRGPVCFVQVRPGRAGRQIRLYKLRTLYLDSDARLARHLAAHPEAERSWRERAYIEHDPRVAGRAALLARRFGLDELPQLWNVLRGDMALVGPRPIEAHLLESLFATDERQLRGSVSPGLTGLWQVRRPNPSVDSLRKFDMLYLRRRSLAFDLWILLCTPSALWRGRGA